jgi:hypothetical protein
MARDSEAFVVWIDRRSSGNPEPGEISGQVEHVATSRRQRFASREELLRFIAAQRAGRAKPPAPKQPTPGPGS